MSIESAAVRSSRSTDEFAQRRIAAQGWKHAGEGPTLTTDEMAGEDVYGVANKSLLQPRNWKGRRMLRNAEGMERESEITDAMGMEAAAQGALAVEVRSTLCKNRTTNKERE
jgi:hypothetical protein